MLILLYLLFTNISKVLVMHLESLLQWTEHIIQGNFNFEMKIKTNDEIEKLANNFNKMRISLKESFERAKQKHIELKQLADLKSDLINNLIKELKSPLEYINKNIEILRNESNKQSVHYQNNIFNNICKIEKIIQDIDILSNNNIQINLVDVQLYPFFVDFQKNYIDYKFADIIKGKKISIENLILKKLSKLDFFIKTDKTLFLYLLEEIFNNSLKFNKENGNIILDIIRDENFISIIIEDTGYGIREENLDEIFEPFFKESQLIQGLGIGLSVVKTIIEKLNYKLEINSVKEQGTKVVIKIPIIQ